MYLHKLRYNMNIDDIRQKYAIQNDAKGDGHNWFNKMMSEANHQKEIKAGEGKRKDRDMAKYRDSKTKFALIFKARDEGLKKIQDASNMFEAAMNNSPGLKNNARLKSFVKSLNDTRAIFEILTKAAQIKRGLGE